MGVLTMTYLLSCFSLFFVAVARRISSDVGVRTHAGSSLVEVGNGMYRIGFPVTGPHIGEQVLDLVGGPMGLEGGWLGAIDFDMETGAELLTTMSGIVDSAREGRLQPMVTGTCRMVTSVLMHTGCPVCGLIVDIGMRILFQDDGAENTLWDQVSQQVRQEIDEALLVTQFDRVDKYMQAFKVQISDSPFFDGQATRDDGPSLKMQYMWLQVLDHDLAVNVGEFVPPAVHPSSGQPISARQREPFLTVATLYMTSRLAILGKMRFLALEVAQIGGHTFLGTPSSIERAVAQIDRKALTAKRDLVPPLAVLYYELMEPGVMSFNRRHQITQLARHTLGNLAPSNCLLRQRELRGAQWRIPNLDHCIVPPLFREPETGYPLTREIWSQITFPLDDPYEPEVTSTGAARCHGQYAVRSIVCTGQDDRGHAGSCAGADSKIVCTRVHDSSDQGGYGILTTTLQFGTVASDGRLFALCPENFFAYGIDFDTSFSLLCQSHTLVTMLDSTIFQRSISSETGENGVCDLNMLKGVVVGMRCAENGCPLRGEGAVVVLCKLLVTQKDGSILAPGASRQLDSLTTTPNHLFQYASVDLRSDHLPTLQTLSAKISGLEGDVVDPGFCPLLPKPEIQHTSCRARLISALTCNNGDDESLRANVDNDLNLGQHFVFKFFQAEANAMWNFTTDFAIEERVVFYLDSIACKPNNGADGVDEPGCEQVTPSCQGAGVPAISETVPCDRGQLRAHVSLTPAEVGWHTVDVYTGLQCSTSWMSTSPCIQQLECHARWRVTRPGLDGYEFLADDILYNGQEPVDFDEEDEL